jgi:hypothetical protein
MIPNKTPYEAMVYAEYPSCPGISPQMLVVNEPERRVLNRVGPKKRTAAEMNHLVEWTFNHRV